MKRIPIEEMKNPMGYNVSLCFEWKDWDSCVTFEIVSDGPIKSKVEIVERCSVTDIVTIPSDNQTCSPSVVMSPSESDDEGKS